LSQAPVDGGAIDEVERLRQSGARIQLLPLQIPASASRLVRQAPEGHPDPSLVPTELWPLLCRHGLYGLAQPSPPP
jgi:nicotinate-nucleotide adenylyltransferase